MAVTVYFSCQKQIDLIPSKKTVIINQNAADKNKQLIDALISGNPFAIDTGTLSGQANNSALSANGGGYSITVIDQMLKFSSNSELINFLVASDNVVSLWDPANDVELQGLASEKPFAGEPALNYFDSSIGFNSLRRKFAQLRYDDENFRDTIRVLINNPDYLLVLNKNNEVQIGDTIYKFIGTNIVAKISNSDYTALHLLRNSNGAIIMNANVKYYNPNTNIEYVVDQHSPLGTCTAYFTEPQVKVSTQDYKRITLTSMPIALNQTGGVLAAIIDAQIDWGYGSSTTLNTIPSNWLIDVDHTYNVTGVDCKSFSISIRGTIIATVPVSCNGMAVTSPGPKNINICPPVPDCTTDKKLRSTDPPTYFNYGGYNYRINGVVGADNNRGLFGRNIIYAQTYWDKNVGGTWRQTSNKKVRLGVEVYNKYYTNECTTPNNFWDSYWHFNRSDIIVKYSTNNDKFGYVPNFAFGIRSNHYVRIVESNGNVVEFSNANQHYLK